MGKGGYLLTMPDDKHRLLQISGQKSTGSHIGSILEVRVQNLSEEQHECFYSLDQLLLDEYLSMPFILINIGQK